VTQKLPQTPFYFPIEKGLYEVAPGLRPLKWDFKNGDIDSKVFQIAQDFSNQRENKEACLLERTSKYVCTENLHPKTESKISQFIIQQLCEEHPEHFSFQDRKLNCQLTGEVIEVDAEFKLVKFHSPKNQLPLHRTLDALALQFSEDIAITQRNEKEEDWLSYLNLCSPSHWAAEDKIGLSFVSVHVPIPGIERILKNAKGMVEAMIAKGPFQRFIWSFVTDTRLNHHPVPPTGWEADKWKGRSFDLTQEEPFYLRIERQTTFGQPEVNASLFTIRIYFIPASQIKADPHLKSQLVSALESMTPESRIYKGVAPCFDELIYFLNH